MQITTQFQTIEQLENQRAQLVAQLRNTFVADRDMELMAKIKDLEIQITRAKDLQLLARVNREQKALREAAQLVFDTEPIQEDITTNGGYFHATKIKKYPKIAKLTGASAKFEDGVLTQINYNGNRFYLCKSEYKYGTPTVHTRITNFDEFLQHNGIQKEITEKQYFDVLNNLQKANEKFEAAQKEYEQALKSFDASGLRHIGLLTQRNKNIYTTEKN